MSVFAAGPAPQRKPNTNNNENEQKINHRNYEHGQKSQAIFQDGERKMKSGQKRGKNKNKNRNRKEKPSKRTKLKWAAANVCVGVDCSTGKTRLHTNRRDKAGHASAQELE